MCYAARAGRNRQDGRSSARCGEVRKQLAERAIVRMDRAAALLRVVLNVDLRRAAGVCIESRIRNDCQRRRRHLYDGDGGDQNPAER